MLLARVSSWPILLIALMSVLVGALAREAIAAECRIYTSMGRAACEVGGPERSGNQCYECKWSAKGQCQKGLETDCINTYRALEIQVLLNKKGYSVPSSGKFDVETKNAVMEFQKSMKLVPDGKVGEKALEKLRD